MRRLKKMKFIDDAAEVDEEENEQEGEEEEENEEPDEEDEGFVVSEQEKEEEGKDKDKDNTLYWSLDNQRESEMEQKYEEEEEEEKEVKAKSPTPTPTPIHSSAEVVVVQDYQSFRARMALKRKQVKTAQIKSVMNPSSSSSSSSRISSSIRVYDPRSNFALHGSALDDKQRLALDIADSGQNLFFTGGAGVGKSFLIQCLTRKLRHRGVRLAILAPTGIAACPLEGQTIHSFFGFNVGSMYKTTKSLVNLLVFKKPHLHKQIQTVQCLVVDEVSMLDVTLFEKMDHMCRTIRKKLNQPFGGIQMICSGDFYQLPPVHKSKSGKKKKKKEEKEEEEAGTRKPQSSQSYSRLFHLDPSDPARIQFESARGTCFAFQSPLWDSTFRDKTIVLTRIFRQTEVDFMECLNDCRRGILTEHAKHVLGACVIREPAKAKQIQSMAEPEFTVADRPLFLTCTRAAAEQFNAIALQKQPPTVSSEEEEEEEVVYEAHIEGNPEARLVDDLFRSIQPPRVLRLRPGAQVILTSNLDPVHVNGSRGVVVGHEPHPVFVNTSQQFHFPMVPRVKFQGDSDKGILITEQVYEEGVVVAHQLPLNNSYALTVHKAQGMSLDRVDVSLQSCFEYGQAYVALSRAKTKKGLRILWFHPKSVQAHPKVKQFYEELVEYKGLLA